MFDREYRERVLRELHLATNQPLRHTAEEHPAWAKVDRAPKKVVIATESYRKIALLILQFLILNQEDMPEFYQETAGNMLQLLANLKKAFHNGNGESNEEVYIGEFFGKQLFAQPTKGEKHTPGLTQQDEAFNKAEWLAQHPYQDEENEDTWYIGLDTLDAIWVMQDGVETPLPKMPKPSSWPNFPADWRENQAAYQAFKTAAIDTRFPEGARLEGVTAGVLVNGRGDELAISFTSISTLIDQEKLRELVDLFDPNAAAFGVLQLLLDFEEVTELDADQEFVTVHYPKLTKDQEKVARLFALAQIMGAPAWLVIDLITTAAGSANISYDNQPKTTVS